MRKTYLLIEFVLAFIVFPGVLFFFRHAFGRFVIPCLLALAVLCFILLIKDEGFNRKRLWNTMSFRFQLKFCISIFLPGGILLTLLTWIFRPEIFLAFPKSNTGFWLLVMVLYPLLSVYPQELIFRTFLFHRYQHLFPRHWMVIVSGLSFGIAHLFFANWIAPILSMVGGILFARTYQRSSSTLQAAIEHSLWGDLIFTIGLGWYFYGGSIGHILE